MFSTNSKILISHKTLTKLLVHDTLKGKKNTLAASNPFLKKAADLFHP